MSDTKIDLKYEAFKAFKDGKPKLAIEKAEQQLREDPEDPVTLSNLGVYQMAVGHHKSALMNFTKSLTVDNERALTYSNRGDLYYDLGLFKEAQNDYETCLKLNPDWEHAREKKKEIELLQPHFEPV